MVHHAGGGLRPPAGPEHFRSHFLLKPSRLALKLLSVRVHGVPTPYGPGGQWQLQSLPSREWQKQHQLATPERYEALRTAPTRVQKTLHRDGSSWQKTACRAGSQR